MNDYKSLEINELSKALSLAQSEMKVASKDSSNPFFKSSYANLQSIIEASRPALCKNGLSVIQQMITENGQEYLVTMLCHSSGQWVSSQMRINPAKQDVQSLGCYITYLRRYSYAALVGVYDGTEDDDGNEAVTEVNLATPNQISTILSFTERNKELEDHILNTYKVKYISHLKSSDAGRLIAQLSK